MLDQEDDGTRIGVWVALAVVLVVVAGVVGGVALRTVQARADAESRWLAAQGLVDAPLGGELVGKLYFDTGLARLPADAPAMIGTIVRALAATPSRRVLVASFHDASGDPTRHAALARQRALAARSALRAAGADPARIVLRKPEPTSGDGSLQEARRVELRLID